MQRQECTMGFLLILNQKTSPHYSLSEVLFLTNTKHRNCFRHSHKSNFSYKEKHNTRRKCSRADVFSYLTDRFLEYLAGFLFHICQTIYIPAGKIPEEKELWAEYNCLLIRCQMADYLFLHVDNIHQYSAQENTHIIHINKHAGGGSDDDFTSVPTFLFGDSVYESAHINA